MQTSASFNSWVQARKENNFAIYAPELEKMLALKRKQAELYGYDSHPYDALLDEYERDATVAMKAAAAGLGIALARSRIAVPYLERGQLIRLPVPAMPARWGYYLVYPAHRRLRPAAQAFLEWLMQNRER